MYMYMNDVPDRRKKGNEKEDSDDTYDKSAELDYIHVGVSWRCYSREIMCGATVI